MNDPYTILGINQDATPDMIKSAFRQVALRYHPDKHGGDPDKTKLFCEAKAAYQYLISPRTRQETTHSTTREKSLEGWAETFHDSLEGWAAILSKGGIFRTGGNWTVQELEESLMRFFERYGIKSSLALYSRKERFQFDGAMYWISKGLLQPTGSISEEQASEIYYGLTPKGKRYVQTRIEGQQAVKALLHKQ